MDERDDTNRGERQWDVLTVGETMLRLNAPGHERLEATETLDVRIGGSESNTAIALARLGLRVAWSSRLPDNPLGRRIENEIRRWHVNTDLTFWDDAPDARAGLYFIDFGLPPRPTEVWYDRAGSSASKLTVQDVETLPVGAARLLHLSGITPTLSQSCEEATASLIDLARGANTPVSFDTNYRARLWTPERARTALAPLLAGVSLLLCPQSDAETIFRVTGTGETVAKALHEQYGPSTVVVTCGAEGVAAFANGMTFALPPYPVFPRHESLHRVGSGDAFNAGVLMGFLEGDLERGIGYGMAMAALKHTMPGDLLLSTRNEIEAAFAQEGGHLRR